MRYGRMFAVFISLLAVCSVAQPPPPAPRLHRPPDMLRVALTVDGSDRIFVKGNELWIVHDTFELPSDIKINGHKWNCQWNKNESEHFTEIDPPFTPLSGGAVDVRKSKGRGAVQMIEPPTEENGFTACIKITDQANGPDKYEFTLSWEK